MTTYTRTHVYVRFANPYLVCDQCGTRVRHWHDMDRCGCRAGTWNRPCEHHASTTSICPSWSPVDGCQCKEGAHGAEADQ